MTLNNSMDIDLTSHQDQKMELDYNNNIEEEDEIVYEMDVYFSQELSNSLYLLQYPLRNNNRSYDLDLGTLDTVKFKPNNELLEFTYKFDKTSPNYDHYCNMESRTDEIKLKSLKVPPKCNYAVGMFRENQIHLTPLKSVLQLRPNLDYIDQFDADKKKQDDVSKDDEESAVKSINVQYKKQDSERVSELKKSSYSYLASKIAGEQWKTLDWQVNTIETKRCYEKLIALSAETIEFPLSLNQMLELNSLEEVEIPNSATLFTHDKLKYLPLDQQIAILFTNGPVLKFSQLESLNLADEVNLFLALERNTYLIQGCFVRRSKPGDIARDYLLTLFWKNRIINRESLKAFKLSLDQGDNILNEVAIRKGKSWEFRLPTDYDFIKNHPELVERHEIILKSLEKLCQEAIDSKDKVKVEVLNDSVDNKMQLAQFLDMLFAKHGVCSEDYLTKKLFFKKTSSDAGALKYIENTELLDKLKSDYHLLSPGVYCRKMLSNANLDKFRVVLLNHFSKSLAPLKKNEVALLMESNLSQTVLGEADYNRLMKELAVYSQSSTSWTLKQGTYDD